jgi:hypothetical protein
MKRRRWKREQKALIESGVEVAGGDPARFSISTRCSARRVRPIGILGWGSHLAAMGYPYLD